MIIVTFGLECQTLCAAPWEPYIYWVLIPYYQCGYCGALVRWCWCQIVGKRGASWDPGRGANFQHETLTPSQPLVRACPSEPYKHSKTRDRSVVDTYPSTLTKTPLCPLKTRPIRQ